MDSEKDWVPAFAGTNEVIGASLAPLVPEQAGTQSAITNLVRFTETRNNAEKFYSPTSVNCSRIVRCNAEKLSSDTIVSTTAPSAARCTDRPSMLSIW